MTDDPDGSHYATHCEGVAMNDLQARIADDEAWSKRMRKADARIVAICGGGDWADASVCHVVVPKDLDMGEAKRRYDEWYATEFRSGRAEYRTFPTWLVEHAGAREADDSDVEEFWET